MKCLFKRLVLISIVCAGFLFGDVHSSQADIGPEPWAPGNSIGPSSPTQVRMVDEYVQMDLLDAREVDPLGLRFPQSGFIVKVKADFRMRNLGSSSEDLKVYFPLGIKLDDLYYDLAITDFQARVNDQPVNIEQEEYHLDKEKDPFDHTYTSAAFQVHFPTNQDTLVNVTYTIGSKFVAGVGDMESIAYVFETGAGWKGAIGKAVLTVNLLNEGSRESIMRKPANGQRNGSSITWTWTNFEPVEKDNFSMVLVNPRAWEKVIAARHLVDQNPEDGAAWTRLAIQYLTLATGNREVVYPYFAGLAKSALQKAIQFSPYDREPHYQLYVLYLNQAGLAWGKELTQAECDLLVSEMNQFLVRSENTEGSSYDQEMENVLQDYDEMTCPNKPKLTRQREIFPTLTASPVYTPTDEPTEYPFAAETLAAFRKAHGLEEVTLPTETLPPTWTSTARNTPAQTLTQTSTPRSTETQSSTSQRLPSSTPSFQNEQTIRPGWAGVILACAAGISGVVLWQAFRRKRAP